jgi:transposase
MTINHKSKVPMREAKNSADPGASQEARRATGDAPGSARPEIAAGSDSEVVPRARRRTFSNAEKRRILQEADQCTQPGEIGALMRREGVYSSSLSTWRRQREAADLAALAPQKRGPKADASRADAQQIAQLTRERDKLRVELDKAQRVIEVQKKVTALLDLLETENKRGST